MIVYVLETFRLRFYFNQNVMQVELKDNLRICFEVTKHVHVWVTCDWVVYFYVIHACNPLC